MSTYRVIDVVALQQEIIQLLPYTRRLPDWLEMAPEDYEVLRLDAEQQDNSRPAALIKAILLVFGWQVPMYGWSRLPHRRGQR